MAKIQTKFWDDIFALDGWYIVCLVGVVEHGLQLVDILELLVQEHVVDVVVLPANRCKFPIFLFHVSCAFFVFRVGHVTIF